jgi:uncharacterized protein YjbI with pentapeptide repeats
MTEPEQGPTAIDSQSRGFGDWAVNLASRIEKNGIVQLVAKLSVIISLVSGVWTYVSETEARQQDRINSAWRIVAAASSAGGNAGAQSALQFLNANCVDLSRLNLRKAFLSHVDLSKTTCRLWRWPVIAAKDADKDDRANSVSLDIGSGHFLIVRPYKIAHGGELLGSDFSGADLSYANFSGANLFAAKLANAGLVGANLTDANVAFSDMANAMLTLANMSDATLTGTDLSKADLQLANLKGTDLRGNVVLKTNLSGVHGLTQEQLDEACMNDLTILPAGARHSRPCTKQGATVTLR